MIRQKALLTGGLVTVLALGWTVGAQARSGSFPAREAPFGPLKDRDFRGLAGLRAQSDVPGLDDKPAAKASAKPSGRYVVTRQDGTKVEGRVRDRGDALVVETKDGPVEVPKAEISAVRGVPAEAPAATPQDKPDAPPIGPTDKPTDATPGDKPADATPGDKPADKPADATPGDKPGDKPTDKPADATPADKPADKPGDKPADATPGDKPADKPGDKPADKPGDKPADKPGDKPADKPGDKPADKPAKGTEPVSAPVATSKGGARLVERPLYPSEEAEFGPVLPDHRGPLELSLYGGWTQISPGIGTPKGGFPTVGIRLTANFGEHDVIGIDLDYKAGRPPIRLSHYVGVDNNLVTVSGRSDETIHFLGLSVTYRLRNLRFEYLMPYASIGGGMVIFDSVRSKVLGTGGSVPLTTVLAESVTAAPTVNVSLGFDYKLDPNWSLRLEARDEIIFTGFNSRDGSVRVRNAITVSIGVSVAFD